MERYYTKENYPHNTQRWLGELPKLGMDSFGNRWAEDNRGYVYLVNNYAAIIIRPSDKWTYVSHDYRHMDRGVKYYYDNFTSIGYDRTLKQKIVDLDKDIPDEHRKIWEYLEKRYNFL